MKYNEFYIDRQAPKALSFLTEGYADAFTDNIITRRGEVRTYKDKHDTSRFTLLSKKEAVAIVAAIVKEKGYKEGDLVNGSDHKQYIFEKVDNVCFGLRGFRIIARDSNGQSFFLMRDDKWGEIVTSTKTPEEKTAQETWKSFNIGDIIKITKNHHINSFGEGDVCKVIEKESSSYDGTLALCCEVLDGLRSDWVRGDWVREGTYERYEASIKNTDEAEPLQLICTNGKTNHFLTGTIYPVVNGEITSDINTQYSKKTALNNNLRSRFAIHKSSGDTQIVKTEIAKGVLALSDEYAIGDRVCITNMGNAYTNYRAAYQQAWGISEQRGNPKKGDVGSVIACMIHEDGPHRMVAVQLDSGDKIIIGERGIESLFSHKHSMDTSMSGITREDILRPPTTVSTNGKAELPPKKKNAKSRRDLVTKQVTKLNI